MPESEVAVKLRRSRNAIVRRVRLLISRATGAGLSLTGTLGLGSLAGGGGLSVPKPASRPLQPLSGKAVSVVPSLAKAVDGSEGCQAFGSGSGASSLQRIPSASVSGVLPVEGSAQAVSKSAAGAGAVLPGATAALTSAVNASVSVSVSVPPPVDPGEAAAVRAILSARAAAAVARSTTSLPQHLLDPLIQCIRRGPEAALPSDPPPVTPDGMVAPP